MAEALNLKESLYKDLFILYSLDKDAISLAAVRGKGMGWSWSSPPSHTNTCIPHLVYDSTMVVIIFYTYLNRVS